MRNWLLSVAMYHGLRNMSDEGDHEAFPILRRVIDVIRAPALVSSGQYDGRTVSAVWCWLIMWLQNVLFWDGLHGMSCTGDSYLRYPPVPTTPDRFTDQGLKIGLKRFFRFLILRNLENLKSPNRLTDGGENCLGKNFYFILFYFILLHSICICIEIRSAISLLNDWLIRGTRRLEFDAVVELCMLPPAGLLDIGIFTRYGHAVAFTFWKNKQLIFVPRCISDKN